MPEHIVSIWLFQLFTLITANKDTTNFNFMIFFTIDMLNTERKKKNPIKFPLMGFYTVYVLFNFSHKSFFLIHFI